MMHIFYVNQDIITNIYYRIELPRLKLIDSLLVGHVYRNVSYCPYIRLAQVPMPFRHTE
jgi:hypothetical protein